MTPVKKIIYHASRTEFARFFWAGSLTFLADFLILLTLTEVAKVNYLWSNFASVTVGIVMSYLLCVNWVFKDRRYNRVALEFPVFVLLSIIGLALNEVLLWSFVEFGEVHYLVAKAIVTLAVFVINFGLKKTVLFRR